MNLRKRIRTSAVLAVGVSIFSASAHAEIDTFRLVHQGGPCGDAHFATNHLLWNGRSRIAIATNETIGVVMYGHGADFANGASGTDIFEWIDAKGQTVNYPGVPIIAGQKVPKGYVTVSIRAEPKHGLGNRTVTVKWPTGNETISIKVVQNCQDLAGAKYRTTVAPGSSTFHPGDAQPKGCADTNLATPECD